MLTREDNELLCRVGAGTPMGTLMREFWIPAFHSQVLEADGAPRRVRLLGDNFVAFRATDGRVGFFDEGCPHRCTSLALARNEDNALRCVFHGWKIDVSGKVVDAPSEPPERRAEFAAKVRVRHYPVREAGGIVWVYLGAREQPPKFVDFAFNTLPASQVASFRAVLHASWLQGLETAIDSAHLGVLHSFWLRRNGASLLAIENTGPTFDFMPTDYGYREAATRDLFDGTKYLRLRDVVAPFYSFIPMEEGTPHLVFISVPIDDEWHAQWYVWHQYERPFNEEQRRRFLSNYVAPEMITEPIDWVGFMDDVARDMGNSANVWKQNRLAMREGHWTGLSTFGREDFAVAEAPGPISDRSREYLGYSDSPILRFRRMMLQAVRTHMAGGPAIGLEREVDYQRIRTVALRAPTELNWKEVDPINPPESL